FAATGQLAGSTSAVLSEGVNPAATGTSLASSANPATSGQPITFTAVVAAGAPGAGIPTGTVVFSDGGNPIGSIALDNTGTARFIVALDPGSHTIVASYQGDGNFLTSASAALAQAVNQTTATALSADVSPSVVGQT